MDGDDPDTPLFDRYTQLFAGDDELVISRRVDNPAGDEILTQDDRFDVDGHPVRVTSGVRIGPGPNGTVQMLVWDGMVSAPTLGRIDLSADRPEQQP